ncbi:MAG TPA: DUF262 domain-containing protein [Gallionella sp.]|nr:DUF262 domain-containing protein [Gallionella sp.]
MPGDYEKAITIESAMKNIVGRRYLLPAIQRKFTWSTSQICVLFDSIMRGYPINTFMFWEVKDQEVKSSIRFYQFLEKYCERFAEDNPDFNTRGHGDFHAVIDGQQRLTSLYIGLKGTYAYRLAHQRWPQTQDDRVLPPRRLYLNIAQPLDEDLNEAMMSYEFAFLTDEQRDMEGQTGKYWFPVGDMLDFEEVETPDQVTDVVMGYLEKKGLSSNTFARKTLARLYFALRRECLIHYYNETSQKIGHVLDIFIRTNHGGKPLSFSDLLMSIAIANWQQDAREQIDGIVRQVRFGADTGFLIDRDWVLKAALMLTDADVRFKVENFTGDEVEKIECEWDEIRACILETFRLIQSFGLNDASLRAKNAAIPIAYYLYHKNRGYNGGKALFHSINNQAFHAQDRKLIRKWLHMSLLKGVFSGQGDTLLSNLRKHIKEGMGEDTFPLSAIIEAFRGTTKNLLFDDDLIARLLKIQKDDPSCFSVLALLMPDLDYTRALEKDHLHPASAFSEKKLNEQEFLKDNPELKAFYLDKENWNGIVNLHLLEKSRNQSKLDAPLAEWQQQQNIGRDTLLIPDDASLDFKEFRSFVEKRSQHLSSILGKMVARNC